MLGGIGAKHAEPATGQADDRAHRAHDAVALQAGTTREARLGAQVMAHRRTIRHERVARERGRAGADAVRPEQERVPAGSGPDLQPLLVLGEAHRRGQRDVQAVGEELHRDVEELLLVVDLQRESPEIGDDRLLALADTERLERRPGLVDVHAQAGEAVQGAVLAQPGHALMKDPAVLAIRAAKAELGPERLLPLRGQPGDLETILQVVGVDADLPAVAELLTEVPTGEVLPALVAPGEPVLRVGRPQEDRDPVDDAFESDVRGRDRSRSALIPMPVRLETHDRWPIPTPLSDEPIFSSFFWYLLTGPLPGPAGG